MDIETKNDYKTITKEDLNEAIKKHQLWLIGHPDGERMYLEHYDLSGRDFSCKMLDHATLRDCILRGACFVSTSLLEANFNYSDVTNAHFIRSSPRAALFQDTIGTETTELMVFPMACPDTGSFIGWKKVEIHGEDEWCDEYYGFSRHAIAKLLIPEDALRSSGTGRKCRCNKALVLAIEDMDGNTITYPVDARSTFDSLFTYRVGDTVEEPEFDPNRFNVCSKGIHFFINRSEAVMY